MKYETLFIFSIFLYFYTFILLYFQYFYIFYFYIFIFSYFYIFIFSIFLYFYIFNIFIFLYFYIIIFLYFYIFTFSFSFSLQSLSEPKIHFFLPAEAPLPIKNPKKTKFLPSQFLVNVPVPNPLSLAFDSNSCLCKHSECYSWGPAI